MPAISTTLRSWISPQEPRVAGRFSADTRLPVSWRSVPTPSPSWRTICASSPCAWRRSRSRRPISLSIRPSFSCTGADDALDLLGARAPSRRSARSCSARRVSLEALRPATRRSARSTSSEIAFSSSRRRSCSRLLLAFAHVLAPALAAALQDQRAAAPSRTPAISRRAIIGPRTMTPGSDGRAVGRTRTCAVPLLPP